MLQEDDLLRSVREIEIRTDRLSEDFFAGGYSSVFKGLGLEFEEVREYAWGDDVRSIDWNVTARTGAPHVKTFVEERELTVMMVVDASGSLDFGTQRRSKAEAAAEICALVAFSAIKNNDKVGLLTFTSDIELHLPPRKGRKQVLRVIREILSLDRENLGTDLRSALEYAHRTLTRRAVVFVVSDFRDEGFLDALAMLGRKHDVIAVDLFDPREHQINDVGLIELQDAETGRHVVIDTSIRGFRRALASREERRSDERRQLFAARAIDLIPISTQEPAVEPLIAFFERRKRRMRR